MLQRRLQANVSQREDRQLTQHDHQEGQRKEQDRMAEVGNAPGQPVVLRRIGIVLDVEDFGLDCLGDGEIAHRTDFSLLRLTAPTSWLPWFLWPSSRRLSAPWVRASSSKRLERPSFSPAR